MIKFLIGMAIGVVIGAGGLICISACKASKFDIFDDQAAVPEDKRASKERYDDIY